MVASWTSAEETALLEFLVDHKSEAGDNGMFKLATFEKAAASIADLLTKGTVKTAKVCQNKYSAFRTTHRMIKLIKSKSGWTWSDETGASITPDTASSWDDSVAHNEGAKPFRNKGWSHLDLMEQLSPSPATGAGVFHPTGAVAPLGASQVQDQTQDMQDRDPDRLSDQSSDESPPPSLPVTHKSWLQ
ncbi:hypothetical protein FA15DRAFT_671125 [Coprinopsis marcescibilis]|uniref:Myb/SANT-like domain-containing protein n=1 Tax=Coprinopsis marcescibilis TaxID=230819 RepID=A0A5C3KRC0_COPMA|nr:hypothetical protein FA15DRAFT_671125 [Coprinopsis marcescibilis]